MFILVMLTQHVSSIIMLIVIIICIMLMQLTSRRLLFTLKIRDFFFCIEDLVRALGGKSRYFSSLFFVIINLRSCMDNLQTG